MYFLKMRVFLSIRYCFSFCKINTKENEATHSLVTLESFRFVSYFSKDCVFSSLYFVSHPPDNVNLKKSKKGRYFTILYIMYTISSRVTSYN